MRRKRRYDEPRTPDEWQLVVNSSAALRMIHDCKLYGLIDGGPEINVERVDDLLARGLAIGVRPNCPVEDLAVQLIQEFNATVEDEAKHREIGAAAIAEICSAESSSTMIRR